MNTHNKFFVIYFVIKTIPIHAWTGPYRSRRLSLQYFQKNSGKAVSPAEISLVLIFVRG
jgi:hypothetical protein